MSEEKFKFRCLHCSNKLKAPINFVGERIRCPHCDSPLTIPNPVQASTDSQPQRQIRGMGDDSQKIKKMTATSSSMLKAESRREEKLPEVDLEADTDALEKQSDSEPQAPVSPDTIPTRPKPIIPGRPKADTMRATKSVKLSSSQKEIAKSIKKKKKTFRIKKKK